MLGYVDDSEEYEEDSSYSGEKNKRPYSGSRSDKATAGRRYNYDQKYSGSTEQRMEALNKSHDTRYARVSAEC